jgi:hypothetical protein
MFMEAVEVLNPTDYRIIQTKKALVDALHEHKGIVSHACQAVGVARSTFYDYWNNDPQFQKDASESQETALDHVEGKLHELIDGVTVVGEQGIYQKEPNVTATIFYLKTKGKKRGYVEKVDVEHSGTIQQVTPHQMVMDFIASARRKGLTTAQIIEGLDVLSEVDRGVREDARLMLTETATVTDDDK